MGKQVKYCIMLRLKDAVHCSLADDDDDPLDGSWLRDLKLAVVGGAGGGRQWMAGCCPPGLLGLGLSPPFKGLSPPSKRAEPTKPFQSLPLVQGAKP